ncbi:MAG: hypothetical protein P9L98_05730 [Candidatus Kaelpia imicola]|nr:hypothetical protein [Candidatus Kaelpia imicola]
MAFEIQNFLREERLFFNKGDIQKQLEVDRESLIKELSHEV